MRKAGKDTEEKHRRMERKKGGRDENFVHDDLLHEWLELVLRLGLVGFIFVSLFPLIPSTFSFLRCRSSWLRILIFPLAPEKDFSVEQGIEQGRRKKKKTMNAILRTSMAFFPGLRGDPAAWNDHLAAHRSFFKVEHGIEGGWYAFHALSRVRSLGIERSSMNTYTCHSMVYRYYIRQE